MIDINETLSRTALLTGVDFYPDLSASQIVAGLTATTVRLRADAANAASPSGQTAISTAAIAAAQAGARLLVDVPGVPVAGRQPPLEPGRFDRQLIDAVSE